MAKNRSPKEKAADERKQRVALQKEIDAYFFPAPRHAGDAEPAEVDRRRKERQERNLEASAKKQREDALWQEEFDARMRDKYAAPTKIPWGRSKNVPTSKAPSYKKVSETPKVTRQRAADKAATAAKRKAIKTPKAPAKKKAAAPVVRAKAAPKKAPKKARAPARKARAPAKKNKGKTHWTF